MESKTLEPKTMVYDHTQDEIRETHEIENGTVVEFKARADGNSAFTTSRYTVNAEDLPAASLVAGESPTHVQMLVRDYWSGTDGPPRDETKADVKAHQVRIEVLLHLFAPRLLLHLHLPSVSAAPN